MARRSKRLRKKLHKRWLADVRNDLSVLSTWRARLIDADSKLAIDSLHTEDLPSDLASAIRRWDLRFEAYRTPAMAPHSGPNTVQFKFEAAEFPELVRSSWNNPEVR